MATLSGDQSGVNRALTDSEPSVKLAVIDQGGSLRRLYDSFTVPAADELGTSSFVLFSKLPQGAKIVSARINAPASGATGSGTVGWRASDNGDEVADLDGLYTATQFDPGNAAIDRLEANQTEAWYNKKFDGEVQLVIDITQITADAGGDKWELEVFYVMD